MKDQQAQQMIDESIEIFISGEGLIDKQTSRSYLARLTELAYQVGKNEILEDQLKELNENRSSNK